MLRLLLCSLLLGRLSCGSVNVSFSESSLTIVVGQAGHVDLILSSALRSDATIVFNYGSGADISVNQSRRIIDPLPPLHIRAAANQTVFPLSVNASLSGELTVGIQSDDPQFNADNVNTTFFQVESIESQFIAVLNQIVGWIYFAAWSVSFYPQVFTNWRRKSVVGLNLDFCSYNILGFLAYSSYNVGLYWIDYFQRLYLKDHPHGVIPVQLSDVLFALHALFITIVTVWQCIFYDRGDQRVSVLCIVLISGACTLQVVMAILAATSVVTWLIFLQFFSYIKIGVTLVKYCPQAYMNYRRKSTIGWSIGNVLLDFTGGILSIFQMILLAYNFTDWSSIFGNPTKFALGFFSVMFDCVFMVQHFCLYRDADEDRSRLLTMPDKGDAGTN